MTFGSKTGYVTEIKEEGLYTENYATLPFGEGMILFNDNSASRLDSPFNHSYDILAVKKENDTDDIESYSVRGERLVLSGNTYYIVSFLKDEIVYKNAFIDATGKTAYFDATFEMIYGDDFMDDKALYTVTCGDFSLTISYMGAGGVGSRTLAESWFGLYSNGEADLIIINANTAFFNNSIYNVSLNENTLVLTNGVRKLTFTLDLENKAYTFVSDEEDIKTAPNFRGLTFTGVFHDGWDDENTSAVVFDDYESDDAITGTIWYGPANSSWAHPFTFTATYDLTSNTLAMEITGEIYREGIAGKTTVHAICEDGKMTFTDNLSSYYTCDNDVFVCEGFVL